MSQAKKKINSSLKLFHLNDFLKNMLLQNIFIVVSFFHPLHVIALLQKKTPHIDKPTVSIRFEPPSPIIENDHMNVTLHCDVVDGNPGKLLKVQWMMNDDTLAILPKCNGKEDVLAPLLS